MGGRSGWRMVGFGEWVGLFLDFLFPFLIFFFLISIFRVGW